MKPYYIKTRQEIIEEFHTHPTEGLQEEAVEKKRAEVGENKLEEKESRTVWQAIFDQFKDFLIWILIIASGISIALGETVDGVVILGIVLLNAILGVVQEQRASNALKALQEMASPNAKVIRNGKLTKIPAPELVPGDLVLIEAGDFVPADIRLIESVNLKVQEAALTGESVPIEKDVEKEVQEGASLGDRTNMIFMSTIVTYGRGKGVVTATGMQTEIGNIAAMIGESEEEGTPLQKKLGHFGKILGVLCLLVCAVIFVLGLVRGEELFSIFMTAVSLAVAAIPEGLPAVVTVVLALGMQRMVKRNAIMKRLGAVETLGSTTVICTDKTGTLTQNKMMVVKVFDGDSIWEVTGMGYSTDGQIRKKSGEKTSSENLEKILQASVLCNDAKLQEGKDDIIGDPTEGALLVLGAKGGYPYEQMNKQYPRIAEFPFDSDRKLMSTLHQQDAQYVMYTKGAPDELMKRCKYILEKGQIIEMTPEHRKILERQNRTFAKQALRVLGYGFKALKQNVDIKNEEKDLVFLGLTGMIDPPREEAKKAVALCHKAGIRVVMITGDHKTTASAIAKEIGIIKSAEEAMDGHEIDTYDQPNFLKKVEHVNVFARVSPEHKVRIVTSIRENGEIAAMTGDGVNDAPALKKADIGIAMGITGTDVSKEAADMVLTDDNFASIVDAVEEGRIIFSNIRKFVGFLLSCNVGELLLILAAMLFNWGTPLLPIQLLWINLITDSFPAFALGMEEKEEGIMNLKPRDPDEPIMDRRMMITIIFQSIALSGAALLSYRFGFRFGAQENAVEYARTFCFVTLISGEILRAYSARSENKSIFTFNVFSNRFLNISVLGALGLLFIVLYIPVLQGVFHTIPLSGAQLGLALLFSILPLAGGELSKLVK